MSFSDNGFMHHKILNYIPDTTFLGIGKELLALIVLVCLFTIVIYSFTHLFRRILILIFCKVRFKKYASQIEILHKHRLFKKFSAMIVPICLLFFIPMAFPPDDMDDMLFSIMNKILMLYVYATVWIFLIETVSVISDFLSIKNHKSIRGFIQIIQLLISVVIFILAVSMILEKSPFNILAGLGASAAVVMFVFKDTILGFVASVQLSVNNMLQNGDWIAMPKYGADGIVIEIGLTAVKVKNWDNTIVNVPTYSLVSDSFQNWRGMSDSGGRRIMRSISIDMHSVKFCDDTLLNNLSKVSLLSGYIDKKKKELLAYNTANSIDGNVRINSHRLTNIGLFREYLERYLSKNANVYQHMTHFVRQLQPTEKGLPIELYFFTTTNWILYENIQSEIFDHIIAVVPEFDLRIFQDETSENV